MARPRDDRPRDDRPREDRPREDKAREDRPREDRRPAPAPQLRFEDGTAEARPTPAPIFESPAAVVAQIAEAPAAAPKPRAVRAKKPAAVPEGQLDV